LGAALEGLDRATSAWGWRCVVRGGEPVVVRDVPVEEVLGPLRELLDWGVEESASCLHGREAQDRAREFGRRLARRVRETAADPDVLSLSDLFLRLASWLWDADALRSGAPPAQPRPGVVFTRLSDLFRLDRATARRPRFRLLDLFLDPATAEAARRAYDTAVEGAPGYALEEFGTGAIPFDLYVPGRGRGTLFRLDGHLVAHTNPRTVIETDRPVCTSACLARRLEEQVAPGAVVVGKAVALAAMLVSEFVFVLNETGSAYLPRTARLIRGLRREGLDFPAKPVLRVRYRAWDALRAVNVRFRLPDHLAQAFGARCVTGREFARRWRCAVRDQERLLHRLRSLRGPADILSFLSLSRQDVWYDRLREYNSAQERLLKVQREVSGMKRRVQDLRDQEDMLLAEQQDMEERAGRLNRGALRPARRRLDVETHAAERLAHEVDRLRKEHAQMVDRIGRCRAERDKVRAERRDLTQKFRRLEGGEEAREARRVMARVERAAERERLDLARRAILTAEGLPHADLRPSAWWFPLVDPSGAWFGEVRRTAQFRLERLDGDD
jgi:hypothetical protein